MKKQIESVQDYKLLAANGRHIRTATKVVFTDGMEIKFTEKMSKKEAIKNAEYQLSNQ